MASLAPSTNGSLRSNTLENALYEALIVASNWELDTAKNPTAEIKIAIQQDFGAKRLNANFTFNLGREKTATGSTAFPVLCQLTNTNYSPGSGGTLVSTNIYAAIIEICEEVQKRDAITNKNPLGLNTVTSLNYDSETLIVTGSVSFVVDTTIDSTGGAVSRARIYLID